MKLRHLCLATIALAALALPASASIIDHRYDFQVSGIGGPTPTHAGSFSFSYDDVTGASVLTMIDFAVGLTPFTTFNASVAPHSFHWSRPQFILGGVRPNRMENVIEHNTDDFWLIFRPDTGIASHFAYSQLGTGFHYSESVSLAPAAVPEPAAWPLFALAIGLLTAASSRLRRRAIAR